MRLRHFVVTDIVTFHALLFHCGEDGRDFRGAIEGFEFEGEEYVCSGRRGVAVAEFRHGTRVDGGVEIEEAIMVSGYVLSVDLVRTRQDN